MSRVQHEMILDLATAYDTVIIRTSDHEGTHVTCHKWIAQADGNFRSVICDLLREKLCYAD